MCYEPTRTAPGYQILATQGPKKGHHDGDPTALRCRVMGSTYIKVRVKDLPNKGIT